MGLIQTTAPTAEPVTLADAKNHLRIDDDILNDDALITLLISAARKYGEMLTGRSWMTQSWKLQLDSFYPSADCGQVIELDRGIVQSIDSITYLDTSSTQQTMDLTLLAKDLVAMPARISPKFGTVWPIALPQIGAVQINYTAGYGSTAASVPEGIRQWMLVRISTLYEHREEVEQVARGKIEPMPFIDSLLDPYKVLTL